MGCDRSENAIDGRPVVELMNFNGTGE